MVIPFFNAWLAFQQIFAMLPYSISSFIVFVFILRGAVWLLNFLVGNDGD